MTIGRRDITSSDTALLFTCLTSVLLACSPALAGDTITVTLPADVVPSATRGRLIVFFIDEAERRVAGRSPMAAPFFDAPQPVLSVAATIEPGGSMTIDESVVAWPVPLGEMKGTFRAQAVFRTNPDERSHRAWGNPFSEIATVELDPEREDRIELSLSQVRQPPERVNPDPEFGEALVWVRLRSEVLSAFRGRDVFVRAGVALPPGYFDAVNAEKRWATIYVIPGFGGREDSARNYARMFATRGADEIAPLAIHVVLDPEGPFGHHGFADSTNSGPVGVALVDELIPHLESRFRMDATTAGRIVTGHSSGGWSALWLTLMHPETFGACWSNAPDPVDFGAFQMTDLYVDENLFVGADGGETPSYRLSAPGIDRVLMTTRQEIGVEHAMDPAARSGQQWSAWMAMFSPALASTRSPAWVADPVTGVIDRFVVEGSWANYDIAGRIVGDRERFVPLLSRVRLAVGTHDSFYLDRAVRRLAERLVEIGASPGPVPDGAGEMRLGEGPGYIWFVSNATHDTVVPLTTIRWNSEMRAYIEAIPPRRFSHRTAS